MDLLVDIFGFLSVLLHGAAFTARSLVLGGIAALWLLAPADAALQARFGRWLAWSALALAVVLGVSVLLQGLVLAGTVELPAAEAFSATFALAGGIGALTALLIAVLALRFGAPRGLLLLAVLVLLACAVASSHGASRLDDRAPLMLASALHQAGVAVWIGGIPYFLVALAAGRDGADYRRVGKRFSQMSMASVALVLAAGIFMAVRYIGSLDAFYGTAYGVMVGAKIVLMAGLLMLGGMNFLLVERLRRDPATPVLRLRRFAEIELGVGITVLFAAASLTSVPPAVDLTRDRVSLAEYVERLAPKPPRLVSPDHDKLAIPALQAKLDAETAAHHAPKAPEAFVPGAGAMPPRNANDIAWSEYNHHVSGILVLSIGLLALLARTGRANWANHWPLLFLALAVFLLFRSDPEAWPTGSIGFWDSLRDPEVVQHRVYALLLVGFTVFEWRVRTGQTASRTQALVFPMLCAIGGALLLTHSHALANVKEQLIIEVTHFPLSLFGIGAGWARWLELRYDGKAARVAGWVWPLCLVGVGLVLLSYREA